MYKSNERFHVVTAKKLEKFQFETYVALNSEQRVELSTQKCLEQMLFTKFNLT